MQNEISSRLRFRFISLFSGLGVCPSYRREGSTYSPLRIYHPVRFRISYKLLMIFGTINIAVSNLSWSYRRLISSLQHVLPVYVSFAIWHFLRLANLLLYEFINIISLCIWELDVQQHLQFDDYGSGEFIYLKGEIRMRMLIRYLKYEESRQNTASIMYNDYIPLFGRDWAQCFTQVLDLRRSIRIS